MKEQGVGVGLTCGVKKGLAAGSWQLEGEKGEGGEEGKFLSHNYR
jgi:hypothetical protein